MSDAEAIHQDQPVETATTDLSEASAAVVLLHGRGARATGMLDFAQEFDADDVAYLAPQAARATWYPRSFLAPVADNEPWLSSALAKVGDVLETVVDAGLPPARTAFVGFSQGGCLASEFVARNAHRYGGLAALSGGLIGPEGTPREYEGSLEGTPVFLGCSDRDPHIPVERVHETADVLDELGGDVTENIYEGMGHTINEDELDNVAALVANLTDD